MDCLLLVDDLTLVRVSPQRLCPILNRLVKTVTSVLTTGLHHGMSKTSDVGKYFNELTGKLKRLLTHGIRTHRKGHSACVTLASVTSDVLAWDRTIQNKNYSQ